MSEHDTDTRLDKHSDKIIDLDRRVTRTEAKTESLENRMEGLTRDIATVNSKLDSNHSDITRQLTNISHTLGTHQGQQERGGNDIRNFIALGGVLIAAAALLATASGLI